VRAPRSSTRWRLRPELRRRPLAGEAIDCSTAVHATVESAHSAGIGLIRVGCLVMNNPAYRSYPPEPARAHLDSRPVLVNRASHLWQERIREWSWGLISGS
jgi:hypothetical protein